MLPAAVKAKLPELIVPLDERSIVLSIVRLEPAASVAPVALNTTLPVPSEPELPPLPTWSVPAEIAVVPE